MACFSRRPAIALLLVIGILILTLGWQTIGGKSFSSNPSTGSFWIGLRVTAGIKAIVHRGREFIPRPGASIESVDGRVVVEITPASAERLSVDSEQWSR